MALDLDRGNRLEVPWLSGKVFELGRQLGMPTPTHAMMYAMLKPYAMGRIRGMGRAKRYPSIAFRGDGFAQARPILVLRCYGQFERAPNMRTCEIAIIGLGLMGSSALHSLARRGADVLGFDPLRVGDTQRLLARVLPGLPPLQFRERGLHRAQRPRVCGMAGAGGREWKNHPETVPCSRSRPARLETGGGVPRRRDARRRHRRAGHRRGGQRGVCRLQPAGGLGRRGSGERRHSDGRRRHAGVSRRAGASVIRAAAQITPTPAGIRITTADEEVMAEQVIVAAGPWIANLVPGLARHLTVTRQAVGWFRPAKPESVRHGAFPIFILEGSRGMIYGFPDFEGRGVKAAQHDHGPVAGPDQWGPPPSDDELEPVSATLRELIPGAAGPIVDRDICLYTNTRRADVRIGRRQRVHHRPAARRQQDHGGFALFGARRTNSPVRSARCWRTWRSTGRPKRRQRSGSTGFQDLPAGDALTPPASSIAAPPRPPTQTAFRRAGRDAAPCRLRRSP